MELKFGIPVWISNQSTTKTQNDDPASNYIERIPCRSSVVDGVDWMRNPQKELTVRATDVPRDHRPSLSLCFVFWKDLSTEKSRCGTLGSHALLQPEKNGHALITTTTTTQRMRKPKTVSVFRSFGNLWLGCCFLIVLWRQTTTTVSSFVPWRDQHQLHQWPIIVARIWKRTSPSGSTTTIQWNNGNRHRRRDWDQFPVRLAAKKQRKTAVVVEQEEKAERAGSPHATIASGPEGVDPGTTTMSNNQHHHRPTTSYTLEYSPNFHRHVVRFRDNGTIVQSFMWLDEALQTYPAITLLPLDTSMGSYVRGHRNDDKAKAIVVAGGGLHESTAYPPSQSVLLDDGFMTNRQEVTEIFESHLMWFPAQVERLMEQWPLLQSYPPGLLRERLQFLLAPMSLNSTFLDQANITDDIDWPYLLYHDGCGAGMSVAQVSHALQVLPEPLLLRLDSSIFYSTNDSIELRMSGQETTGKEALTSSGQTISTAAAMARLYEQTPPLVLQMTMNVLHLWVTGVTHLDIVSLAYLHWRGWEWQACRILLHAFRSSLTSSAEPSGVRRNAQQASGRSVKSIGRFAVSSSIQQASQAYLQARLQIRPWHLHALINTHSRLSTYSPSKVKSNLDYLQRRLHLQSAHVQAIVLIMPSLLGSSVDALETRIQFWTRTVGLTTEQLRDVVSRKPVLLQYSVDNNLIHKLEFFTKDLGMTTFAVSSSSPLPRMTCINPELWGRSLDRYLVPMAQAVCTQCDSAMTLTEYGKIVAQVPELMRYSILNIEKKIVCLKERVGLTGHELKTMIQVTPRILLQSYATSLQPKIELVESFCTSGSRDAIHFNPSLLTITKGALLQRLRRTENSDSSLPLAEALKRSSSGKRRRKAIWLLSNEENEVELEFGDVAAASIYAATTQSKMYNALRRHRPLNGRYYVYVNETSSTVALHPLNNKSKDKEVVPLSQPIYDLQLVDNETAHLTIHTAGCAFPPENTVRGRKRAGGMALQVRDWSSNEWRQICSQMWKGLRVRLLPDSQTLILGYPYTRPSRPRCSLYSCREAIRLASQWLTHVSQLNAIVTIICESNYVLGLLQNSTQVMEWGCVETKSDILYNGPGSVCMANTDILYPLSRAYCQMKDNTTMQDTKKKNVTILLVALDTDSNARRLRDGAKLAAKLMYDTVR